MFQTLVSHNDDIRRLVEKGYAVGFDPGYLIVRDVLYLDAAGELQVGAIVTKYESIDQKQITQHDHQIFFAGGQPYDADGTAIPNLGGGPHTLVLSDANKDVAVQRSFSNKPRETGRFADFFEKIESYVRIISGPALAKYPGEKVLTFRAAADVVPETVFKFNDTLTSRAEIVDLAAKFKDDVIAIIGLGGTGAYLLDFMVKTPVREIRGFDHDDYYVHNAYRSPGRLACEGELGRPKAEVYASRYDNFRTGITLKKQYIDQSSAAELVGVTFAFVCVDKGSARRQIVDLLLALEIPFIDVGMNLHRSEIGLTGMMRTTFFPIDKADREMIRQDVPLTDAPDAEYRVNIQIAELNALNAALAVLRFKQLRGFYSERNGCYQHFFDVVDMKAATIVSFEEN